MLFIYLQQPQSDKTGKRMQTVIAYNEVVTTCSGSGWSRVLFVNHPVIGASNPHRDVIGLSRLLISFQEQSRTEFAVTCVYLGKLF